MNILKNSVFYHIPKTGGTWVSEVLSRAVEDSQTYEQHYEDGHGLRAGHVTPIRINKEVVGGRKSFCFVRHPVSWYQSYWRYKNPTYWDKTNEIDVKCESPNFNTFIENVLREYPDGYVTWLYGQYAPYCDFVGKQEQLGTDLVRALDMFAETYNPDYIYETPMLNVSNGATAYTPENLKKVLEVERKVIDEYYSSNSNN